MNPLHLPNTASSMPLMGSPESPSDSRVISTVESHLCRFVPLSDHQTLIMKALKEFAMDYEPTIVGYLRACTKDERTSFLNDLLGWLIKSGSISHKASASSPSTSKRSLLRSCLPCRPRRSPRLPHRAARASASRARRHLHQAPHRQISNSAPSGSLSSTRGSPTFGTSWGGARGKRCPGRRAAQLAAASRAVGAPRRQGSPTTSSATSRTSTPTLSSVLRAGPQSRSNPSPASLQGRRLFFSTHFPPRRLTRSPRNGALSSRRGLSHRRRRHRHRLPQLLWLCSRSSSRRSSSRCSTWPWSNNSSAPL